MPLTEIRKVCEVSLETPAEEQSKLHNRWHPDIPFADTIKNGETVKIECVRCLAHVSEPRTDTGTDRLDGRTDRYHARVYNCD
jgi:acetamidase/formamidase